MNEHEQFLKSLEDDKTGDVDILEAPLVPDPPQPEVPPKSEMHDDESEGAGEQGVEGEGEDDGGDIKPKNRRERRLMAKLQAERESNIFQAGKLAARTEAARAITEESDYLKSIERIYGREIPEAELATDLFKKVIKEAVADAKTQALVEMREERRKEVEAERAATAELRGYVDDIEDTYDVTLTAPQRQGYLELLQRMSPKDEDGNVTNYADPHAVWDVFQDRLKKPKGTENRAKALSARSMTQSGASKDSSLENDTHARYLQEQGII